MKKSIFLLFIAGILVIMMLIGTCQQPSSSTGGGGGDDDGTTPEAITYTVTYDGNENTGGNVPVDSTNYEQSATVTVLGAGTLVKTGYTFLGWSFSPGENGGIFMQGQTLIIDTSNITLYAVWLTNSKKVFYFGNYNTDGTVPNDNNSYEEGSTITVLGNTGNLVRTGYKYAGWNDGNGLAYEAGDTFTMGSSNVFLYAIWIPYKIRDIGPAGGWIFYDKGSYSNGWRYLEAAPSDQTSRIWGTMGLNTWANETAIGSGKGNTIGITGIDPLTNKAADECYNLIIINGSVTYDDWFLPSKDELNQMYVNLKSQNVGNFNADFYWSSSEFDDDEAWQQDFYDGYCIAFYKDDLYICIRAIRAF